MTSLLWFRQDLRLDDNPAFIHACSNHESMIPLYIYDENSTGGGAQDWWLHHSLTALSDSLQQIDLQLILRKGNPLNILLELIKSLKIDTVFWNRCYEPAVIKRDKLIKAALLEAGIHVQSFNGSLLNEPWTVENKTGGYYKVFTPYWKHCLKNLHIPPHHNSSHIPKRINVCSDELSTWNLLPKLDWADRFADYWTPGEKGAQVKLNEFIENNLNGYATNRDIPTKNATSHLSPHLHFGEISPWAVVRTIERAKLEPECDFASIERFLSELGWREFSTYLLYHFPQLPSENFKEEFNAFPWKNDEEALSRWQKGMTGYPLVDAGMRELWATGYMHNRVRMIVASFLTKGLLIDWRVGADWFLDTLVDADLANNSASWQWVAGCGADAAPYFRIFNPILQSQKFDPNGTYIRQWVPELSHLKGKGIHEPWLEKNSPTRGYPKPLIDHKESRDRALEYYKRLK